MERYVVKNLRSILMTRYEIRRGRGITTEQFTYERITRRKLLDSEVPTRWPVRRWDAPLGWLLLLLDVDVRVHAFQAAAPISIRVSKMITAHSPVA